jgi:uncharacterized protein
VTSGSAATASHSGRAPRAVPERRCVQKRSSADRSSMIRFVVGPDGQLVPDLAERLPGRGVWLTADRDVISKAVAGHAFARAFRRDVRVPPELLQQLESLLRTRCVETLGLARRGGALFSGFDRVADGLRQGKIGLVVAASDAAEGQSRKLGALGAGRLVIAALRREELGRAIGRDDATYVGVASAALATRLTRDLTRLAGVGGRQRVGGPDQPVCENGNGDDDAS